MDRIAVGREDGAVGELEMAPRSDQRIVVAREEGDAHPQPLRAATQALDAAGFERIAVRRMTLPHKAYVTDDDVLDGAPGLSRRRLARRFRDISELDLRTAAAHYLYRKPAIS